MTWGGTTAEKRLPPATPPNRLFGWQPVTDSPSTSTTTTADLSDLAGTAVVLRFHLDGNARLYSYRFGDPDPHLRGSD